MITRSEKMRFPWLPYFFTDILAITLAYYATVVFRFRSQIGRRFYDRVTILILDHPAGQTDEMLESFYYASAFRLIVILAAVICVLYALRHLYAGRRFVLRFPVAWNVVVSNFVALMFFYTYWYLTRNTHHPRSLFATVILLNILFCVVLRVVLQHMLFVARKRWKIDRCAALLVGSGPEAALLEDYLGTEEPHGVYCSARLPGLQANPFSDWLKRIAQEAHARHVDLLVVADPALSIGQIMQVIELSADLDIPLKLLSDRLDVLITEAQLPCDILYGMPLVHFNAPARSRSVVRKGLTVCLAACLTVLAAPVLLVIVGLIRWTSPGSAIFKQKRIGINRKPFNIYKFRTMRHMAEDELADLEAENQSAGALFKIKRDPRITPVGRFLRRFSLDELPQLFNVVRGEMAIVGPRPLPERDFEKYEEDWHYIRHGGLPGLTCLWQISGRSNLDFHQMCILDIYYLRNHTWIMDLSIVLQTVRTVLFGIGAY